MLMAACNYVLEASRLGYDYPRGQLPADNKHREGFGWIDVRDGSIGPKDAAGQLLFTQPGQWPAPESAVRCPMYVMKQPPFAVQQTIAYRARPKTLFLAP